LVLAANSNDVSVSTDCFKGFEWRPRENTLIIRFDTARARVSRQAFPCQSFHSLSTKDVEEIWISAW